MVKRELRCVLSFTTKSAEETESVSEHQEFLKSLGEIQKALDELEMTPEEWVAEYDTSDMDHKRGLLSYFLANSADAVSLKESPAVKARLVELTKSSQLDRRTRGSLVIALQSVKLPEALPWLTRIATDEADSPLAYMARLAVRFQNDP